jgi:hypothetical protein
LDWAAGGDRPDIDLYARVNADGNAVYYGNSSDGNNDCGGWSLEFQEDIYAGCSDDGSPPEQIFGSFNSNKNLYIWFNQHSDCADELGASNVTGSVKFVNRGEDFTVNNVLIAGGTTYVFDNQSFDYVGFDNGSVDSYQGGALYEIEECADCEASTFTPTATADSEGSTPTATADSEGSTPTATAGGGCALEYEEWVSGNDYMMGDLVCYQGVQYLCDGINGCDALCGSPADDTCAVWVIDT